MLDDIRYGMRQERFEAHTDMHELRCEGGDAKLLPISLCVPDWGGGNRWIGYLNPNNVPRDGTDELL